MEAPAKFLLPSPNFDKTPTGSTASKPHYLTPSGMTLLPREKQPPPMYGPRGATLPPNQLKAYQAQPQVVPQTQTERVYCEPCEMEFHTQQDYRRHRNQHEPCPVDGCKFRGHYSVMDGHVMALHSTGLFDKVKSVSTPEEIAAWRDERKKKYPTVENVKLRQQAQQERMKRGERLEANKNRFGRREDRQRPFENKSEANNNKMKNGQKKQKKRKPFKQQPKAVPKQNDNLKQKEESANPLSLLAMYGSADEEEEEKEKDNKAIPKESKEVENSEIDHLSDDAPEEAPIERKSNLPEIVPQKVQKKTVVKPKFVRKSGLIYSNLYKRKQNTMLEKLLETEIRHERNVLLQCVRYVVDNNFFGIAKD